MDFIGFSKYLGASDDNFETFELEPTKYYIESCFLYECPFLLKPCLLKRNENKVVLVFDTYDQQEVLESLAEDYKFSASWEATQVLAFVSSF